MMDINQLLETWAIHNRINLYVLDAIQPAWLKDVSPAKGRKVGEQLAHIHNVRLMWLKVVAPDLLKKIGKVEKEKAGDKNLLRRSLTTSGEAIKDVLQKSLESDGKVKGFKPHAPAFLGYLIAHEAHHRAQLVLVLKQCGHPLPTKILYGMWEWGVR
jgi:uncharacterized damage-inducible protein DinB